MKLDWPFILQSLQGKLIGTISTEFKGISTDTRTIRPGDLYVALQGDMFDGHMFAKDALIKGASGVLVRKDAGLDILPRIEVDDPLTALQTLAGNVRKTVKIPVIAITGSHGKTTTKDILSSILAQSMKTRSTFQNLNGLIGVPLTLMQLEEDDQVLVIEVGISKPGEMEILAPLVSPTHAVFTCIAPAHSEFLPTLNDIVTEKLELAKWIIPGGRLFLNADDPLLIRANKNRDAVLFGLINGSYRASHLQPTVDGMRFDVEEPIDNGGELFLPLHGAHNVYNALGAVAVARTLGFSYSDIQKGLNSLVLSPHRSHIIRSSKLTIIDDAYNAAPGSMRCALRLLADYPCKGRRIAVLGDMLELGSRSVAEHESLGTSLKQYNLDVCIMFGEQMKWAYHQAVTTELLCIYCEQISQVIDELRKLSIKNDVILVKASRSMRAEKIVEFLKSLA